VAGYGMPDPDGRLPLWITWVAGINDNPMIVQGASGAPDSVTLVGAFGPAAGALSSGVTNGTTVLSLDTGQGANVDTSARSVIFVGRSELARVTQTANDTLIVSAHPTQTARGLSYPHAAGAPVELVQAVTYRCILTTNAFHGQPYLVRELRQIGLGNVTNQAIATGIEDLQLTPTTNYSIRIQMTARTRHPDMKYTHPVKGDHFHRLTLSTEVTPRNTAAYGIRH
jgi:hypothetical protein